MPSYLKTVCVIMLFIAMCAVHCYDYDPSFHIPQQTNERIFTVGHKYKVDRVPVYLYHQAGDYLPENREIRRKFAPATIASSPYLATRISMEPMHYFNLDACMLYWDNTLVITKLFGMKLSPNRDKDVMFDQPLDANDIDKFLNRNVSLNELNYLKDETLMLRHKLQGRVPLMVNFMGTCTLFYHMCGGKDKSQTFINKNNKKAHQVFDKLKEILIDLHNLFKHHGVEVFQYSETRSLDYSTDQYRDFCLRYAGYFVYHAKKSGYYTHAYIFWNRGCQQCLIDVAKSNWDIVAIDETIDIKWARGTFRYYVKNKHVAVQGNFDPNLLLNPPEKVRELTMEMVRTFGKENYIANLGHAIWPKNVSIESVRAFVDAVHDTFN